MRIAFITPGFSSDDDDWCIPVLRNLALELRRTNDVRVFTISYPHRSDAYFVKGVPVQSFGTAKQSTYSYVRRMMRAYEYLNVLDAERPFDVLHGFWADQGGLLASLCGKKLGRPVVVTSMAGELTLDPQSGYGRKEKAIAGRLAKKGAEGATMLTVGSRINQRLLVEQQPGLASDVVSLGVDTELFQRENQHTESAGKTRMLMVGSLVAVKGHAIALRAFAEVHKQKPNTHLHIVGDGPLRRELTNLSRDLQVYSHVTFHGHIEHHELAKFYHATDFCLLASFFESTAMVILEAGACERATIGSSVGLLPEVMPAEYCTPPGDVEALTECIVQLCNDSSIAKELGRQAAKVVNKQYTLNKMEARFEIAYTDAIEKFSRGGILPRRTGRDSRR